VIFPDAPVKLFVTASAEARALRRWRELRGRGDEVALDVVAEDMRRRDAADTARNAAPLRPAPDAVLLDTTTMDAEAAYQAALAVVHAHMRGTPRGR
jgi:cytidylate kinase